MALSLRIEKCKFTEGNDTPGWTHEVHINNMNINIDPAFFGDSAVDEGVSGFLRSNLRGTRPLVELRWEKSIQESVIRTLFNDIITSLVDNQDDFIFFFPDASKTDKFSIILEDFRHSSQFTNQRKRFTPSITLRSLRLFNSDNPDGNTSIPTFLE